MVKLVAQQTADSLSIKEWGNARLDVVQNPNGDNFIVVSSLKKFWAEEVFFYDNKNILIKIRNNDREVKSGYVLLMPNTFTREYADISKEVFDDKYRRVVDYNNEDERLVSLINEKNGKLEFPLTHWKDIIDVHDEVATISFIQKGTGRTVQSLVRFKQNLHGDKKLIAQEIIHIKESLYKYRQNSHLFNLYNAKNMLSSDERIGYTDITYISDQLALGVINEEQWDFIKTFPTKDSNILTVAHTSYVKPVFDNDIISIVSYDDNDEEIEYKINFSGTRLSEGNVLDLSIESGEVASKTDNEIEPVEEIKEIVVPIVTIGRFVFVNDDSVKLSEHSNLIYSKKSLHKPCNIEKGAICWVLAKEKVIVITRRDGISDYRRSILYKKELPDTFDSFNILSDQKWYVEDCFICTEEEEILDTAIETIKSKLQEKVNSIEIKQQTNDNLVINDTKDTLKLKAIYHFLQQQGFDNDAIYKALYILFPSIEQFIDLTNVKIANAELCKRIEDHSRIRDLISSDTDKLIEMLNLNEKELAILNYYTKAKGLSIATAIEYVNEESPTGTKVIAKYNELMRIGDILSNERKILREMIIEDLVHRYANLADTSEILKPVTADVAPAIQVENPAKETKLDFAVDETKHIEAVIKDKIHKFCLNGIVKYEIFENKKVYNFNHDIHYVQMGRDILIFISKTKATDLDNEHPHIISFRGNGEDKRFPQVFTHINGAIKNQRENNARIFVFTHNDDDTCKFFDELQYLDYNLEREDGREIIIFKMKSLHRFS